MIELKNINKTYDKKNILKDINLKFKTNAISSIIGPNGAGKSTILNIASRLLKPDNGEVLLDNIPLSQYKNEILAQKISILKQQNYLNIRLKIKDLVAFGRFPYTQGKLDKNDKIKIKQAIEYMNLQDLEDRFLDSLSGGQRQRAFIAMIIAQDTDCILLDEPLNNLDMKHSVQIMQILKQLVKDFQKTIILVLHDINFASVYSDFIIAMKDGMVIDYDSSKNIIQENFLKQIYDLDIKIKNINNQNICLYYD